MSEVYPQVRIVVQPYGSVLSLGFCFAMCGGVALLLEQVLDPELLPPVFRVGGSRAAVEGDLSQQLRGLETEPGDRHTL